jgi:hypothetical protein
MAITKERAEEIRRAIWARHGWTAPNQVTAEEDREIIRFWNTLPGTSSYYDAVARMARGEHLKDQEGK